MGLTEQTFVPVRAGVERRKPHALLGLAHSRGTIAKKARRRARQAPGRG
jgi:hypothetical protein